MCLLTKKLKTNRMASPKKENGYTSIANEILERLVATPLPVRELQMVLFVIRKTYGHQKKQDLISYTQFELALNCSRPVVAKALQNLLLRRILVRTPLLAISFQKDYEKWVVAPPLLVKNKSKIGRYAPTDTGSHAPTHKRKKEITKEIDNRPEAGGVNDVFKIFYDTVNPNINYANKGSRDAAEFMIKKYGLTKTIEAAKFAVSVQSERYAPTITTPYQLKEKLAALIKFKLGQTQQKGTLVL